MIARRWNEFVAALTDVMPLPTLVFLSVLATALVSLAWYFWPHWLPWRWRLRGGHRSGTKAGRRERLRLRLGRLRWRLRWRRRRRGEPATAEAPEDRAPDDLPDLPSTVLALTADQLAAAGRYAEAVRERLRSMVRALVEREVVPFAPGWTVTELARAAAADTPSLAPALTGATEVFSQIWYGLRPARVEDDQAMRAYAREVDEALTAPGTGAAHKDTARSSP